MVLDDDIYVRGILSAQLGREYDVIPTTTAEEAQALLGQKACDIILADQKLPGISGVQFLEWVRLNHPGAIRVLMTAQPTREEVVDAINRAQVHRFLGKPWRAEDMVNLIREAAWARMLERSNAQLLAELRHLNLELEQRVLQRTHELEMANRQLQNKNSILERMALTDPLTGLPNRRAMDRLIRNELYRRSRHPASLALAVVDVDHFKDVNTRFLLPGGDHVLTWLGQLLSQSLRTVDTVGRIGGEEFLILAPETTREGAMVLAERVRQNVEKGQTSYDGQIIRVTVSVGVSVAEQNVAASYEQLKHLAATALSEAKMLGRNRCVIRTVTD
jgi:diguanylate cyclase (GGDEF)-like protein